MADEFPFVEVRDELRRILGDPLPGTRIYRKDGPFEEAKYWSEALFAEFDGLVSPGGVAIYAPVTRASVHQRLKAGKLTGFFYYVSEPYKTWFGKTKIERTLHYGYIPRTEAIAWGKELEERAVEKGIITREELEGQKPDWHAWWLYDYNSRFARERLKGREA
ncbi:MAG: hypothetical protein H7A46_12440 [Verrucomicrobiales bacterium]|nr:hypothetical protein [Verrucomicrobiales bacterium]